MEIHDVKDLIICLIAFALMLIVGFIFAKDFQSYLIGALITCGVVNLLRIEEEYK